MEPPLKITDDELGRAASEWALEQIKEPENKNDAKDDAKSSAQRFFRYRSDFITAYKEREKIYLE